MLNHDYNTAKVENQVKSASSKVAANTYLYLVCFIAIVALLAVGFVGLTIIIPSLNCLNGNVMIDSGKCIAKVLITK